MAGQPLRFIPIGAFFGEQEGIESLPMASAFSPGGCKNFWIDAYARASQILGYTKQNVAAITSHTGGNAMRVRALFHYGSQAAGILTRQELGFFDDASAHVDMRYSTDAGVTWTWIVDLGAGSINTIPDFAQSGNTLVMTNGVLAPQTWDGTTWSAISNTQLAAPTVVTGGAGLKNGRYQYWIVPIKSDGTRKVASVISTQIIFANEKATVGWVADADGTVTGYEVYSTNGTGAVGYFAGSVNGRTTVAFTDNTPDAQLLGNRALQEYGQAPPTGSYFCEMHLQRMWYLRTDTNPRYAYYADAGLPFSVYTSNFLDMSDAESRSDFCVGGTGNYQGMLVVWLERSVWTISGTGQIIGTQINWNRRRTNARIGAVSHRTVARIPAGAKYTDERGTMQTTDQVTLAYFTPFGDVRMFDGDNDRIISYAKKTTLAAFNYANRAKAYQVTDNQRDEVTWIFPSTDASEPDTAVTWNYRFGVWYARPLWGSFAHAIEVDTATGAAVLLAGEAVLATGGFCYLLWNGYTQSGSDISSQMMTKTLYGEGNAYEPSIQGAPLLSFQKRWRWVDLLIRSSGSISLTVEWLPSEAADTQQATGVNIVVPIGAGTMQSSDGSVIQSADSSNIILAGPTIIRVQLKNANADPIVGGRFLYSRGMRLRISCANSTAIWNIVGMNVAYQLLPGLKRPFTQ